MKYIDIKITAWQRLHFKENTDMKALAEILNQTCLDEVLTTEMGFVYCESLEDTESLMLPEQNDNKSTIEIFDNEDVLWDNSK